MYKRQTLGLPQVGAFPGGRVIFIEAGSTTIEMVTRDGWVLSLIHISEPTRPY